MLHNRKAQVYNLGKFLSISFIVFTLILIGSSIADVSELNSINTSYKNNNMTIEFKDGEEVIGLTTLKSHKTYNEIRKVPIGKDKIVIWYEFSDFKDVQENAIIDVEFIDMREKIFNYSGEKPLEESEVDKYIILNPNYLLSIEKNHSFVYLNDGKWLPYNSMNIPKEDIIIGIQTDLFWGEIVDVRLNILNNKLDRHAVVLGVSSGFVTEAPVADPGGAVTIVIDGNIRAQKDSSSVPIMVTEIGWWANEATTDANFEVGIYSDNSGNPEILLNVDRSNLKGTGSGWIKVTGLDIILSANTFYWIAVQLDGTTGETKMDRDGIGGTAYGYEYGVSTLPTTWEGSILADFAVSIYAVYKSAGVVSSDATVNLDDRGMCGPYWYNSTNAIAIFPDGEQNLAFSETTDEGVGWSQTIIATSEVQNIACWYDKETPGDDGELIHIAYLELGDWPGGEVNYTTVDITDGTIGSIIQVDAASEIYIVPEENDVAITKTLSGNLILAYGDVDDELAFKSADGITWNPITKVHENNDDWVKLFPANTGDDNDAVAIYQDVSANTITIKMYDDSENLWDEASITTNIIEDLNGDYPNFDAAVRHSDNHILLALHTDGDSAGDDLKTWDITPDSIAAPTVTAKTNIFTNKAQSEGVAVLINQGDDDVYVSYMTGTNFYTDVDVVYVRSIDDMGSWSNQKQYSEQNDDIRFTHGGRTINATNGRVAWGFWNDDLQTIFINLVNDIEIPRSTSIADGEACDFDVDCDNSNCVEAIDEVVSYCAPATKECSRDGFGVGYDTGDEYDAGVITYICKGDNLGGAACADAGTQNCDEYADNYCDDGSWVGGSSDELDLGCASCNWCGGTGANNEGDIDCENADVDTDVGGDCGAVQCDGGAVTPYYHGWDTLECFYRLDEPDGDCDGSGSCKVASDYCGANGQDGTTGVTCDCIQSQIGCDDTTIGSCGSCQDEPGIWDITPEDNHLLFNQTFIVGFTPYDNESLLLNVTLYFNIDGAGWTVNATKEDVANNTANSIQVTGGLPYIIDTEFILEVSDGIDRTNITSLNFSLANTYVLNIYEPSTVNPVTVSGSDNVTVNFTFLENGINITDGVNVTNVTVGIEDAIILTNSTDTCGGTLDCTNYVAEDTCANCSQCVWSEGGGGLTKINYEDFEGYGEGTQPNPIGTWIQAGTDDWYVYTGNGESGSTGPTANYDGYYAMVETSSGNCNDPDTAILYNSPQIDFDAYEEVNISFAYNLYGNTMGDLHIKENTTGNWVSFWEKTDDIATWYVANVRFNNLTGTGNLAIWMDCGASYQSDAAVDSVNVTGFSAGVAGCSNDGSCGACIVSECDTNCSAADCTVLTTTNNQFQWVAGVGWELNITVPSGLSGFQNLMVNASYLSQTVFAEDTNTNALDYGGGAPSNTPPAFKYTPFINTSTNNVYNYTTDKIWSYFWALDNESEYLNVTQHFYLNGVSTWWDNRNYTNDTFNKHYQYPSTAYTEKWYNVTLEYYVNDEGGLQSDRVNITIMIEDFIIITDSIESDDIDNITTDSSVVWFNLTTEDLDFQEDGYNITCENYINGTLNTTNQEWVNTSGNTGRICSFWIENLPTGNYEISINATEGNVSTGMNWLLIVTASDTCTAPAAGNWVVDCSDNCEWTVPDEIPGNIFMEGSGIVKLYTTWTMTGTDQYIYVGDSCTFYTHSGGGFG